MGSIPGLGMPQLQDKPQSKEIFSLERANCQFSFTWAGSQIFSNLLTGCDCQIERRLFSTFSRVETLLPPRPERLTQGTTTNPPHCAPEYPNDAFPPLNVATTKAVART